MRTALYVRKGRKRPGLLNEIMSSWEVRGVKQSIIGDSTVMDMVGNIRWVICLTKAELVDSSSRAPVDQ